jgi:hypothetical protein
LVLRQVNLEHHSSNTVLRYHKLPAGAHSKGKAMLKFLKIIFIIFVVIPAAIFYFYGDYAERKTRETVFNPSAEFISLAEANRLFIPDLPDMKLVNIKGFGKYRVCSNEYFYYGDPPSTWIAIKLNSIIFVESVYQARKAEEAALQLQAEGDHSMAAEFARESIGQWCRAWEMKYRIAYMDYLDKKNSYR